MNMSNIKEAFIRLSVLVIVLLNQILVMFGYNPLPYSDEEVFEIVSSGAIVIVTLWTWYKNNDTTKEAVQGTKHMNNLKNQNKPL